ncbi:MAG: glutamine--tRNA ligase/YqeY domain fusion protein [Clostridia bacterium]|nr:glutamine--tRNA ligase/YqeY domain fusion protein [Clostridia bacterium]
MIKYISDNNKEGFMEANNFIEEIINQELEEGKVDGVHTRFPPKPNGYLHIGHAKSLCLNFGTAEKYGGVCNLFFDDTNPSKEKTEYVDAIKADIEWLGFKWFEVHYASDFFDVIFEKAVKLIEDGKAFVCDLSAEEISATRGTLTEPGKESPYRNRSIEENLQLFYAMKDGRFADGEKVLRAKIDMSSPNINLRDPVIYRVLRATHHRTGDKWCIYPMYDFAHPICDSMQGVTHSLCTLEFEDHRPLYNWVVENTGVEHKPRQIEFARLNITNTVMSKRYLKKLVEDKAVTGWDDPRMPTLTGLRNRGVPAQALKNFCEAIGIAKANSEIEVSYLEHFIRDYLNAYAERAMAVFEPIKAVITNFPDKSEKEDFEINPSDETAGTRKITFSKEIYIDSEDFSLDPPPKYFRLKKDGYVRLKNAYIIKCDDVVLNEDGSVKELLCSYVPESKSGNDTSGIKVKGVIHWVSAEDCVDCEIRKYDYLLKDAEYPGQDFSERMNYDSVHVFKGKAEPYLKEVGEGKSFQLMRKGYYKTFDEDGKLVLSEIVSLKDSFKPINK